MSDRERAIELINRIPESKFFYILPYLEGAAIPDETPNAETLKAMEELENGGGEAFGTLSELWESMEG